MSQEPKRVGVIGLGIMGLPMAGNLIDAGFDVIGYNRSTTALERLAARGGTAGASVADVARRTDVVITVLPDGPDVESVVLGSDGVLANADKNTIVIDMSTVHPQVAIVIADAAKQAGIRTLDAPVSGGEQGAIDGTLSIMVGGDADTFKDARRVFEAMGKTIVHVGPAGAGQTVKAANQLLVGGIIGLVAEAIVFLEAFGVSMEPAIEVLAGGLAGNRILDRKAAGMVAREFHPGFRVDLHHKDMGIVLGAARGAGVAMPLGALVGQLFTALRSQGGGSLDHSALLKVVESLSGRSS
jgi:2-hydroxy-3-oxopropionate reductase